METKNNEKIDLIVEQGLAHASKNLRKVATGKRPEDESEFIKANTVKTIKVEDESRN